MRKNGDKLRLAAVVMACLIAMFAAGCQMSSRQAASNENGGKEGTGPITKDAALTKKWATLPIPIYISESVPEEFRADCMEALDIWSEAAGVELFDYRGVTKAGYTGNDGLNVIAWNVSPDPKGHFGETHKAWIGEETLIEADVVFFGDPDGFEALTCEDYKGFCKSRVMKKDIITTALHELGHALGFSDTTVDDEIMNPDFTLGDVRHEFDGSIISALRAVYNPLVVAQNAAAE